MSTQYLDPTILSLYKQICKEMGLIAPTKEEESLVWAMVEEELERKVDSRDF